MFIRYIFILSPVVLVCLFNDLLCNFFDLKFRKAVANKMLYFLK